MDPTSPVLPAIPSVPVQSVVSDNLKAKAIEVNLTCLPPPKKGVRPKLRINKNTPQLLNQQLVTGDVLANSKPKARAASITDSMTQRYPKAN
jgi:hypothetical protein